MPFISKDWRSPGELWVKRKSGTWEKVKILQFLRLVSLFSLANIWYYRGTQDSETTIDWCWPSVYVCLYAVFYVSVKQVTWLLAGYLATHFIIVYGQCIIKYKLQLPSCCKTFMLSFHIIYILLFL